MPIAAIYARKSTESEDRQLLSIESQVKELKLIAVRGGFEIGHIFTEAKSAKSPGRLIFNDLLRKVNKGQIDRILCWKLDRLARNPVDGAALIWALEKGTLSSIDSPQRSYVNTGNDKFWMQLEFGMAKKYVDDLSDNVKRGLRAKVEAGWKLGRAPLGYLNDSSPRKGERVIVRDPERFDIIRNMWNLMLSGNHSVRQVLEIANKDWGLRTRFTRGSPNKTMSRSTLYEIFRDPFYCGQFKHNGQLHDGRHEPMITRADFDAVQEMLDRPGRPRPKRHLFYFSGMMRCGECSAAITAEEHFKHIKSTGVRRRYVYYHCTHRKRADCRQGSVSEDALREQVVAFLRRIQIPGPYLKWVFERLDRLRAEENGLTLTMSGSAQREVSNVERRLENLLSMKISPENVDGSLLSDAEYVAQKNRLTEERSRLKERIDRAGTIEAEVNKLTIETFEFAAHGPDWFTNGSRERQRGIVSALGSNHRITNGKLQFDWAKPLVVLEVGGNAGRVKTATFEPPKSPSRCTQSVPLGDGFCANLSLVDDVRNAVRECVTEERQTFSLPAV